MNGRSTNMLLNAPQIEIRSDANGSYDGSTTGAKGIYNFEKAVSYSVAGGKQGQIWIGEAYAGNGLTDWLSGTSSGVGTIILQVKLRARLITAPFTTSTLTWSNYLFTLTIGSTIFEAVVLSTEFFVPIGANMTGLIPTVQAQNIYTAREFGYAILVAAFSGAHGMIVEMAPVVTVGSGVSATINNSVQMDVNTAWGKPYFIYPVQ